jgi:hypothetical protein
MRRLCAFSSYRLNTGYYRRTVAILHRAVVYLCREISAAARRVVESDACPGVSLPDHERHYTTYRADNLAHTDGSRAAGTSSPASLTAKQLGRWSCSSFERYQSETCSV